MMNSSDRLSRLFNYDTWANEQLLLVLQEHESFQNFEKARNLFAHIAATQEVWFRRINDTAMDGLKIWPEQELEVSFRSLKRLVSQWQTLIRENSDELDRTITYENSQGKAFETMLSDILHHLVIHGQHHRAQIATLLRNAKIIPPATDFIFFTRAN